MSPFGWVTISKPISIQSMSDSSRRPSYRVRHRPLHRPPVRQFLLCRLDPIARHEPPLCAPLAWRWPHWCIAQLPRTPARPAVGRKIGNFSPIILAFARVLGADDIGGIQVVRRLQIQSDRGRTDGKGIVVARMRGLRPGPPPLCPRFSDRWNNIFHWSEMPRRRHIAHPKGRTCWLQTCAPSLRPSYAKAWRRGG